MDLPSIQSMPSRGALIDMIKAQLDNQARDEHFKRDVFLCLAVTIPSKQRARAKRALESLLASVHSQQPIKASSVSGGDTNSAAIHNCPYNRTNNENNNNETNIASENVPDELERRIGIVSTLLVLGC